MTASASRRAGSSTETQAVRVGQALREIRDEGLYLELEEGITFEDYCKSRWALPKATAYRQIDAADIHDAVSPMGDAAMPIATERVGRADDLSAAAAIERGLAVEAQLIALTTSERTAILGVLDDPPDGLAALRGVLLRAHRLGR